MQEKSHNTKIFDIISSNKQGEKLVILRIFYYILKLEGNYHAYEKRYLGKHCTRSA